MMDRKRMQVLALMSMAAGLSTSAGTPMPVYQSSPAPRRYTTNPIENGTFAESIRAERERDEWNRRVDAKKEERTRRRNAEKWGM